MKTDRDMWDWVVSAIAALIAASVVYALFNYPELQYQFYMVGPWVAGAGVAIYWFAHLYKEMRESDDRRTRSHVEKKWRNFQ